MRRISDEYELPDDDDEPFGARLRPRRRVSAGFWIGAVILAVLAAAFATLAYVQANETDDASCVSCHTVPHKTYEQRGQFAVGGSLAVDLASYHYQQLRLNGQDIRCIDCHAGDHSLGATLDKYAISARNGVRWLRGDDDRRVEKAALAVPHLADDACASCHRATVLVGGSANHHHNTLPVAFRLWKAGARLTAPADAADPQAIIVAGLEELSSTVGCTSCHTGHVQTETDRYLDQARVDRACAQCHQQTDRGPRQ